MKRKIPKTMPAVPAGCTTSGEVIDRVNVTGQRRDWQRTIDALKGQGWLITYSGAYTDDDIWPDYDVQRFVVDAERIFFSDTGEHRKARK
jgi:hypothetical protein